MKLGSPVVCLVGTVANDSAGEPLKSSQGYRLHNLAAKFWLKKRRVLAILDLF